MATINLDTRPLVSVIGFNQIPNPSGRRTLTNYTAAGGTLTQTAGVETILTATAAAAISALVLGVHSTGVPAVVGTKSYIFSADIRGIGAAAQLRVAGAIVGSPVLSAIVPAGAGFTRVTAQFTPTGTGAIVLSVINNTAAAIGALLAFRDARMSDSAETTPSTYFDGNTPATLDPPRTYNWTGTVDNSSSETKTRDITTEPITPELILGYETTRQVRTIVHPLLSTPANAVTLRRAALRTGTLKYLHSTRAEALKCERFHSAADTLTLIDADAFDSLRYVPQGVVTVSLDPETRLYWIVSTGFQEFNDGTVTPN